jgi:hypothetical protein
MKQVKTLIAGIVLGLLLGLWFGVNLGKGQHLLSNPFSASTVQKKIRDTGEKIIEKSGEALEKGGQALQKTVRENTE